MKILYVTTISNTINAFLIPHIEILVEEGHQVDVAFKTEKEIDSRLFELGCNVFEVSFNRSPMKKNNLRAYHALKRILEEGNYDIVHTHTPIASAITRVVCKNIPKIKVIYTAHGFHFFDGAPLLNWLIYYPIEKYLSKYTDIIITINKEDYNRAKESLKAKRVEYIPGVGIDVEKYRKLSIDRTQKREEINVPVDAIVLLSVGELNRNKNHKAVIQALRKLKNNQIHYVICGEGILKDKLKELCLKNGISERVHFLGHREDVVELYQAADVFVIPSIREGLPVSLMEAMASGLPVVCSNVRGNVDLITNNESGYLFNPNCYMEITETVSKILKNHDKMKRMGQQNYELSQKYDLHNISPLISHIYKFIF